MGLRGKAPTPTKILKARGSRWAAGRDGEPTLPVEAPTCPGWLGREAKAEWRRQVKHLVTMGVIAQADRALLAVWCETWAEFVALSGKVAADGADWRLRIAKNAAADRLVKAAQQFGFSPSARARLRTPDRLDKDKDPFEALLRGESVNN